MADRAIEQHGRADGLRFDALHESTIPYLDQTPLVSEVERLSDPGEEVSEAALINLTAKYFFAFVHPGAQDNPVPVAEIEQLLEMFSRCKSLNEPSDDIEIMNRLRRFANLLALPADTTRAALILHELMHQELALSSRYLGLDIHTGSGLLVLGHSLLARRIGRDNIEVWGIESDMDGAERAGKLLRALGLGNVVAADPAQEAAYEMIGGRPVSLVSTPMVAGETHSLTDQRFFASYETLFRALGPEVERTSFFPEGLIAYSPEMNASLILSKENRFQRPPEHARSTFHPQGLFINGRILPLHRLASGIRSILR